jgi:hypothetical protein
MNRSRLVTLFAVGAVAALGCSPVESADSEASDPVEESHDELQSFVPPLPIDQGNCPGDTVNGYPQFNNTVTYTCTGTARYRVGRETEATKHPDNFTITLTDYNADGTKKDDTALRIDGLAPRGACESLVNTGMDYQLNPQGGKWLRTMNMINIGSVGNKPLSCSVASSTTSVYLSTSDGSYLSCSVRVSGKKLR